MRAGLVGRLVGWNSQFHVGYGIGLLRARYHLENGMKFVCKVVDVRLLFLFVLDPVTDFVVLGHPLVAVQEQVVGVEG